MSISGVWCLIAHQFTEPLFGTKSGMIQMEFNLIAQFSLLVLFLGLLSYYGTPSFTQILKSSFHPAVQKPVQGLENPIISSLNQLAIEPVSDSKWSQRDPIVYRPFKPQYHLTMGIRHVTASELVEIDRKYPERIRVRREIMANPSNRKHVIAVDDVGGNAVAEFYAWLVGEYLPVRYPDIFQIIDGLSDNDRLLHNRVTADNIPLKCPPNMDDALESIGRQVEEDFLFLLPGGEDGSLVLHAYIACFPSGFDWAEKFGQDLARIHEGVPDYDSKLKFSINRYLGRLKAGTFVQRLNWSISTKGNLFEMGNTHAYQGDQLIEEKVDVKKTVLRVECQKLFRLPISQSVVFTIRTYEYTLKDIKEDGSGPELALAIDGLKGGSSPRIHFYKRASSWGESVKEYLLSPEHNGKT